MKNRNCSFNILVEDNGNKTEKPTVGMTLSDAFEKATSKGKYMFVLVEDSSTGQVHEVFANSVKFIK